MPAPRRPFDTFAPGYAIPMVNNTLINILTNVEEERRAALTNPRPESVEVSDTEMTPVSGGASWDSDADTQVDSESDTRYEDGADSEADIPRILQLEAPPRGAYINEYGEYTANTSIVTRRPRNGQYLNREMEVGVNNPPRPATLRDVMLFPLVQDYETPEVHRLRAALTTALQPAQRTGANNLPLPTPRPSSRIGSIPDQNNYGRQFTEDWIAHSGYILSATSTPELIPDEVHNGSEPTSTIITPTAPAARSASAGVSYFAAGDQPKPQYDSDWDNPMPVTPVEAWADPFASGPIADWLPPPPTPPLPATFNQQRTPDTFAGDRILPFHPRRRPPMIRRRPYEGL